MKPLILNIVPCYCCRKECNQNDPMIYRSCCRDCANEVRNLCYPNATNKTRYANADPRRGDGFPFRPMGGWNVYLEAVRAAKQQLITKAAPSVKKLYTGEC